MAWEIVVVLVALALACGWFAGLWLGESEDKKNRERIKRLEFCLVRLNRKYQKALNYTHKIIEG